MEEFNMKNIVNLKITSVVMLLAFSAIPLFAQPGQRQGQGQGQGRGQGQGQRTQRTEEEVKARAMRLAESLECSDVQKKKLIDFEVEQYRQGQTERQKFAGDRDAMREYMRKQRDIRDKKYAEILSEDQMKKYKQLMEERRNQRQRPGEGEGSEGQRGRGRGGN
ncbi:hypothetical protein ACFLTU_07560 [Bacteroidota bacterium]